jgi:hypothetical protein
MGKLHNEKAHNLYSSLNGAIKSRRMTRVKRGMSKKTLLGNLGGKKINWETKERLKNNACTETGCLRKRA